MSLTPIALGSSASTAGSDAAVRVILDDDEAREAFLARVTRDLPRGRVLVKTKELIGRRRGFCTRPKDEDAELVAKERALILRGGLTSVTRYYVVPANNLDADEVHLERGVETHRYLTRLRPLVAGRATAPAGVPA